MDPKKLNDREYYALHDAQMPSTVWSGVQNDLNTSVGEAGRYADTLPVCSRSRHVGNESV